MDNQLPNPIGVHVTNPYHHFAAIRSLDMFFGRTSLLRRFYELLFNHQSVSLIGPRGIGKSSFLYCACQQEMQARFPFDLSRHVIVLLDLGKYLYKESSEEFFHEVSAEIIKQSQSNAYLSLHAAGFGADEYSNILEQIESQRYYPVLILDSFDNITLNEHFGPEFFAFLRAHASSGKVSYVTSTLKPLYESSHRRVADSPFFNIFYPYQLEALTEEEAHNLITQPAARVGLPFTLEESEWVRKEAGLHPFLIMRLCYILFEEKRQSSGRIVDLSDVRKKAYRELKPYITDIWNKLSETQHTFLQDEAQQKDNKQRALPELSESAFFRNFVRKTREVGLARMTPKELEKALNVMNDPSALGETNLRLLKNVTDRLDDEPTPAEKGKVIREVLNEAFETLHGVGNRADMAPDWLHYNILFYRYFRNHLKNNVIAGRLGFTSDRQYYRARTKAIEALRNALLGME